MTQNDDQARPGVDVIIKLDDLRAIDLDGLFVTTNSLDCYDLNSVFREAQKESGTIPAVQLLEGLTNYHFDPDHATEPFRPMMVFDGKRTLVPSDLLNGQIDLLAEFAPSVKHPALRARVADVCWFMQRRRQDMAGLAVESYCDCISTLLNGSASMAFEHESPWSVHALELASRAATISMATKWKLPQSHRLKELIRHLTKSAYQNSQANDFCRVADIDLKHEISARESIATWSESLVNSDQSDGAEDAKIWLWKTAARAYKLLRKDDGNRRCWLEIAECHVAKSTNHATSPMLQSAFLNDAIQILRNHRNTRERREEITEMLRKVQPSIKDEMGSFSHEIDLTKIVEHSLATVRDHSVTKALLALVMCAHPPRPDEARKAAIEQSDGTIHGMMPMQVLDHQGRVVFTTPGFGNGADQDEKHYRYLEATNRDIGRRIDVTGAINPIRQTIAQEHPLSVEELMPLFEQSPFVPIGHEYIFSKGMLYFLAGEDLEAASILTPQLENSLRHLLMIKGVDTTTTDENGIQTEASLSIILNPNNRWREILEENLPERYSHEIDQLFLFGGGPAVRNQMAHGKVPAGGYWDHNTVWATWFILHLALLPLVKRWSKLDAAVVKKTGMTDD